MALSNASNIRLGTILLVIAAGLLIGFAGGLNSQDTRVEFLRSVIVAGSIGIAILLVLQAGFAFTSVPGAPAEISAG